MKQNRKVPLLEVEMSERWPSDRRQGEGGARRGCQVITRVKIKHAGKEGENCGLKTENKDQVRRGKKYKPNAGGGSEGVVPRWKKKT